MARGFANHVPFAILKFWREMLAEVEQKIAVKKPLVISGDQSSLFSS
jgi:hypothetical protein